MQRSTETDICTDIRETLCIFKETAGFIIETVTGLHFKRRESVLTLPCHLQLGLQLVPSLQRFPISIIYKLAAAISVSHNLLL